MNLKKAYDDVDNELVRDVEKEYNLPPSLTNYLLHLGYDSKEKIYNYLNPNKSCFYDPFLFPDMHKIVDRINLAISKNERILVFGDYDADGIGSTAILYKYFESRGVHVDYFLPSRYSDGYGLTIDSIEKVNRMFNPNLIITVDCGITCIKEVEYIKSLGIDVIITDHHEPLDVLPNCPVIDCKIKNQPYPFRCLCGAGMALKVVYALSDYETARKYFTICAISTIADIVELTDENRFIVVEGLKSYQTDCPQGLKYLFKKLKIKDAPTSSDVSYKIAPKINATGRMGDATISLKLYLEEDKDKIIELYKKIMSMNEIRQVLCQKILAEAQELIKEKNMQEDTVLVLKSDNWETGVLGIVCAKLIDCYNKSVVLLGKDLRSGNYVGSARAVKGVNIHEALTSQTELLVTFGGHEMAGGLTITEENFVKFRIGINEYVATHSVEIPNDLFYDILCSEKMLSLKYIDELNRLEPFGVANPKPKFIIKANEIFTYPMNNHNEHLLFKVCNCSGVMFNKPHFIYTLNNRSQKDLFCSLNIEEFASRRNPKVYVEDVYCDEISNFSKDISLGSYFKQRVFTVNGTNSNVVNVEDFNALLKLPNKGVVYISQFSEIKNQIKEKLHYDIVDLVYLSHKRDINTLYIAPIDYTKLDSFTNIVLLDPIIDEGFVGYLSYRYPRAKIWVLRTGKPININVSPEKKVFVEFYAILLTLKDKYFDELLLFKNYFSKQFSYAQFVYCMYVFEELEIIKVHRGESYYIEVDNKRKSNLYNSILYCKMLKK